MVETKSQMIEWLLSGDVSIGYQTQRDLLGATHEELASLQLKIASEGWGKMFMDRRDPVTGQWGNGIYSPKWISTHYTLLDLHNMEIPPADTRYKESSRLLLDQMWYNKGLVRKNRYQDMCIAGMLLSICCHTQIQSESIMEIIDYILCKQYPDGGWNCRWEHGDKHSSYHTTISILEGLRDYEKEGYTYRTEEIKEAVPKAWEFILKKRLFRSVTTGKIIHKDLLMLSYPCRWYYDILRCMDYFQSVKVPYDSRMEEALDIIVSKQRNNNGWTAQHKHPGLVHFDMEMTGKPSRWNTLRVLRVLRQYRTEFYHRVLESDMCL